MSAVCSASFSYFIGGTLTAEYSTVVTLFLFSFWYKLVCNGSSKLQQLGQCRCASSQHWISANVFPQKHWVSANVLRQKHWDSADVLQQKHWVSADVLQQKHWDSADVLQ